MTNQKYGSLFEQITLPRSNILWNGKIKIIWNRQTTKVKYTLKWKGQMYSELDKLPRSNVPWNEQTVKVKCTLNWTNCQGQMYSEMDKLPRSNILWNGQTAKVKCTLKWTNCHGQMYSEMDKLSRSNRLFHSAKIRALTIFHLCLNIQCLFPLHSMPD